MPYPWIQYSTGPPQTQHKPQLANRCLSRYPWILPLDSTQHWPTQLANPGPRLPKTGYIIFSNEVRQKIIDDLEIETGGNYRSQDIIKRTGQIWRGLSSEEKNVFQKKGKEERKDYEDECARLGVTPFAKPKQQVGEEEKEEKRPELTKAENGKDPEPRKPKTGYGFFFREVREKVNGDLRAEMGSDYVSQDVFRRTSELWRALTAQEREAYRAKGAQDRRRYKRECAAVGATPFENLKKPRKKPQSEGEGAGGGRSQRCQQDRRRNYESRPNCQGEGAAGEKQSLHPRGEESKQPGIVDEIQILMV